MNAEFFESLKSEDPAAFATALQEQAQPYFQAIFNKGHAAATQGKKDLEDQIKTLQAEKAAVDARMKELKDSAPDSEKWKKTLADQELAHQTLVDKLKNAISNRALANERLQIEASLVDRGVDKWVAGHAVDSIMPRIRVALGEDFEPKVEFYNEEGTAPLAVAEAQKARLVLVQDAISKMPEKLRPVPGQKGSGFHQDKFEGSMDAARMGQLDIEKIASGDLRIEADLN